MNRDIHNKQTSSTCNERGVAHSNKKVRLFIAGSLN